MNEPNDDPLFPEDALRHHLLSAADAPPHEAWVAAVAARAAQARLRQTRRMVLIAALLGLLFSALCVVTALLFLTHLATWLQIVTNLAGTVTQNLTTLVDSASAALRPQARHILSLVPILIPLLFVLETTAFAALLHFRRPTKSS
jgi:hypothetical protein